MKDQTYPDYAFYYDKIRKWKGPNKQNFLKLIDCQTDSVMGSIADN